MPPPPTVLPANGPERMPAMVSSELQSTQPEQQRERVERDGGGILLPLWRTVEQPEVANEVLIRQVGDVLVLTLPRVAGIEERRKHALPALREVGLPVVGADRSLQRIASVLARDLCALPVAVAQHARHGC